MGASRDDFIKYPRTPHLFGSQGTADDKHLGRKESDAFITDPSLIVEEKLDGTNVGIHFNSRDRMVLQCRGHEITEGRAREQCREHLRKDRDFVFNATDTTRLIRQRWIDLFADYRSEEHTSELQ